MSPLLRSCFLVFSLTLSLAACGDDDSPGGGTGTSTGSGSCTMKDSSCFYVSDPASYDLKSECVAVGHSWSASACPSTGFARRCTQKTKVSVNNGPEQEVSYVYLYPPGNATLCFGTEEKL